MLTTLKSVVGLAAGVGAGILCREAIEMVKPKNASAFARVCIWVTGIGLSAVMCDVAAKGTDDIIDDVSKIAKMLVQKKES